MQSCETWVHLPILSLSLSFSLLSLSASLSLSLSLSLFLSLSSLSFSLSLILILCTCCAALCCAKPTSRFYLQISYIWVNTYEEVTINVSIESMQEFACDGVHASIKWPLSGRTPFPLLSVGKLLFTPPNPAFDTDSFPLFTQTLLTFRTNLVAEQ